MIEHVLVCFLISTVAAHKIIVFSPSISTSHMISNARIADELAKDGHDVVLFEPDFLDITHSIKTAKVARRWIVKDFSTKNFHDILNGLSNTVLEEPPLWQQLFGPYDYEVEYNNLCKELINRDELIEELRRENFDAIFSEQINLCGMALGEALNIKNRFFVSSCPFFSNVADNIGLPTPISFLPISYDLDNPSTYSQRVKNAIISTGITLSMRYLNAQLTDMFREKFGNEFPNVEDIARDADIVFLATDELIDIPTVTLPHIVHIGGLGIEQKHHQLDEKFALEMSKGKRGVILFSLGTIANTTRLPEEVMRNFVKIAQKLDDYHFLVRADKHDNVTRQAAKNAKNVFVSSWLPQPAILGHPRLSAFITHAGYNGLMEAAMAGVPLVTIPFMFDQNRNSRAIERGGWGIRQTKEQLLHEPAAIENAIRTILEVPKYKENAKRLQKLIETKPTSAKERFLKTTNWVLANGGVKELLFDGRKMSIFQYYSFDILLPAVIIPIVILYLILKSLSKIITFKPKKVKTH